MKSKEPRISVRVDGDLKQRIETVCAQTGLDEAQLVRNCIIALCDSVEKNGSITFPLEIKSGKPDAFIVGPRYAATSRLIEPQIAYKPKK